LGEPGGTIRVLGIDPGERAMGLCLVELCGMQLAPLRVNGAPRRPGDAPEPVFRVLLMQLIDLKAPLSPVSGHAVLHYAPSLHPPLPPAYAPVYDSHDIRDLLARAAEAAEETLAERQGRKRKRPPAAEEPAAVVAEEPAAKVQRIDLTLEDTRAKE
jgi:hypothetical protein